MTRLKKTDIADIPAIINRYDRRLKEKTGLNMSGLAARAAGGDPEKIPDLSSKLAAVISVTAGQGTIAGFSRAIAAILQQLNLQVFLPEKTDVAGLQSALEKDCDMAFMADDESFLAFDLQGKSWIDNDDATARIFSEALGAAAGGLAGRRVAVLGCGRIGEKALKYLQKQGARPLALDISENRLAEMESEQDITVKKVKKPAPKEKAPADIQRMLADFELIFEATPAANLIGKDVLDHDTFLAAPGMPAGFTEEAARSCSDRIIHDPLQLGTAAMALEIVTAQEIS